MKQRKFDLTVIWDFFMVLVVLTNLTLIFFDLTYLWLRPVYYKHFPEILRVYDKPILGIEPHRSTEKYLGYVDELKRLYSWKDLDVYNQAFESKLNSLREDFRALDFSTTDNQDAWDQEREKILTELGKIQNPDSLSPGFIRSMEQFLDKIPVIGQEEIIQNIESNEDLLTKLYSIRTTKGWEEEREKILSRMDYQIIHIVETNPFQESGQTENLAFAKDYMKKKFQKVKTRKLEKEYSEVLERSLGGQKSFPSTALAFTYFWRNQDVSMEAKFQEFDREIRDRFGMNYYRHIGKNGKPVNNYLFLDAPFLLFFFLEFSISWYLAVRSKKYMAWFLYPIYHWYDIVGLIPLAEFRIFRLIRVYKIFLLLKTNRIVPVGNDIISRTLKYYSNIIKEEITDMVTIQILTETQEEVRSGASIEILSQALDSHRDGIKKVFIKKMREFATNENLAELGEKLLSESLENAKAQASPLRFVPSGYRSVFGKFIAKAAFRSFSFAAVTALDDPTTRKSVESLVDFMIDELEATARDPEVRELNTDITVEILENVKKSVSKKKWLDTKI